jgi:nucleoside-diphosphate-sugar epimerase
MEEIAPLAKTHLIITGGAGFIGANLSSRLLAAGAHATILTRHPQAPRAAQLVQRGATVLPYDVRHGDPPPALAALPPVQVLLHLAADVGMTSPALRQTNVLGTERVLAMADHLAIPYVLVASSIEAQGLGSDDETPLDEERPCHPVSEYGATKLAAEEVVRAWSSAGDRAAAVIRIGNIYGPGSPWLLRPSLLALLGGTPLAPIYWQLQHRRFQPLFIDDLVHGLMQVVGARLTGLYNLTGDTAVSIGQYFESLAALTGLTERLMAVQAAAGDVARGTILADVPDLDPDFGYLLMGTPERCHRVYDNRKIRRFLGPYCRYDLTRGLAATLSWFHASQGLAQLLRAVPRPQAVAPWT